jgi:quercetin dioxygenase-like cupin family protein
MSFPISLEGEIGARVGDEVVQAATGSYVFKPRGLPHTFWNATTKPARLLELISPAGFEKYFDDLADLLRAGGSVDQITNLVDKI